MWLHEANRKAIRRKRSTGMNTGPEPSCKQIPFTEPTKTVDSFFHSSYFNPFH